MNKPSQQQPGPAKSTSGERTQTNTPPSSERKQPRDKAQETARPGTSQDDAQDDAQDEIKDPSTDEAQTPLRADKRNGDGANR